MCTLEKLKLRNKEEVYNDIKHFIILISYNFEIFIRLYFQSFFLFYFNILLFLLVFCHIHTIFVHSFIIIIISMFKMKFKTFSHKREKFCLGGLKT